MDGKEKNNNELKEEMLRRLESIQEKVIMLSKEKKELEESSDYEEFEVPEFENVEKKPEKEEKPEPKPEVKKEEKVVEPKNNEKPEKDPNNQNDENKKMKIWVKVIIWTILIAFCLIIIFSNDIGLGNIIGSEQNGFVVIKEWFRSNYSGILSCIFYVILITGISKLIRFILKQFRAKSDKSRTVLIIIDSVIKYVAGIADVVIVLNGLKIVSFATIMASAGILSLVIGLGAQSLISDIIAGIFIVFEGDYKVGDIVVIGDWRGTVKAIGVRTTKIEDVGGNVQIINNSAIGNVINLSNKLSTATCDVGTEYSDSLERIETIIKGYLPVIKENVPDIVEGPFYLGVTELGDSSVNVRISCRCLEEKKYQVQRDLNRQIKLMFDKNNISIPFPQIVLNQPSVYDKPATVKQTKIANEFYEEQKEQAKELTKEK